MSRHWKMILSVVVLGAVVAGCGGTKLTVIQTLEQPLTKYRTLYFAVEPAVAEDISQEVSDLEVRVIDKLNKLELFETTRLGRCPDTCANTVAIEAVITDINKVSGGKRFWLGAFAGNAKMTANVTFIDATTGDVIGLYTVTGDSGGTGVSGDTNSVVRGTANEIVKLIQANCQ